MSKTLFGTSGIRGHAEELFTRQFAFDIARTFIAFLNRHKMGTWVALGSDPRSSSPKIKKDLMSGLAYEKVEVFDEGVTPIPSMNWLIKTTPIRAGIMITGSHIAPELNGVKFYAHEEEISVADQNEIEEIYHQLKGKVTARQISPDAHVETKARDEYSEMLFGLAKKPYPGWKVCVDCANGAQSVVFPSLLSRLGFEVIKINCNPQDDFIARDTDTDDKAQLERLKSTVLKENCDFGIAFDGDGDRVVFVDERGEFVQGEYSCSLVAKQSAADAIVTTVSASQVVDSLGKKVYRTRVGSPYVIAEMKKVFAKFGFEPNGGAISGEIMYTRDGGSMAIKLLNYFAKFNGKFSEMVATLPKFYMFRTKVDYRWELKDKIISQAKTVFKGIKIEEIDGVKIWLDETTWILFRSSLNAPEFRIFSESNYEPKSKKLVKEGLALVEKIINAKS